MAYRTINLDRIRADIQKRISSLKEEGTKNAPRTQADTAHRPGRASEERCKMELQGLEAALRRMENGQYGACAVCGEDISPKTIERESRSVKLPALCDQKP